MLEPYCVLQSTHVVDQHATYGDIWLRTVTYGDIRLHTATYGCVVAAHRVKVPRVEQREVEGGRRREQDEAVHAISLRVILRQRAREALQGARRSKGGRWVRMVGMVGMVV